MPKRLHDTGLWNKRWFRILAPVEKAALLYVFDMCDLAGVWIPDFDAAEFAIGDNVDWNALPGKVNDNIQILPNGKWFLPDFVSFQCGCIPDEDTANRAHQGYVSQLKKHGLYDSLKAQCMAKQLAIDCSKEEDKKRPREELDNDLDKDKEQDKESLTAIFKKLVGAKKTRANQGREGA